MQKHLGQILVSQHFSKDHARVESNVCILVALERREEHFRLRGEVLYGRPTGTDLTTQQIVEDLRGVFSRLKFEPPHVGDKQLECVLAIHLLSQLRDLFWLRLIL